MTTADHQIILTGVTALTAADLGLGSTGAGNGITLTAASATATTATATNATAKTTAGDDTIYTVAAYTAPTSIDASYGADTLVVTDGGTVSLANISSVETLDLTSATAASTVSNVGTAFTAVKLSAKGDTITTSATATVITGGAGNDSITGGTANDTIDGGAGNDSIDGGATGVDSILAGSGDDTIVVSTVAASYIDAGSGNDSISSGSAIDALTGTYLGGAGTADVFTFDTGDNITGATISGWETGAVVGTVTMTLAQHNSFADLTGASTPVMTLSGAGGTVALDSSLPVYTGTALTSAATVTGAHGATGQVLTFDAAHANSVTLTGTTTGNVKIVTGSANDTISIASGSTINDSDTITGAAGTDTLTLTGNTAVTLSTSNAVTGIENFVTSQTTAAVSISLSSTYAVDTGVKVTANGSSLTTGAFTFDATNLATESASITGGGGDDALTGSGAADTITGGAGSDTISGGAGADTITVGSGNNSVTGGQGNDVITLTDGGSDIVVLDFSENDTTRFVDTITGFQTGATGDVFGLSKGDLDADGTAVFQFSDGAGDDLTAAIAVGAAVFTTLAPNTNITTATGGAAGAAVQILKFTSTTSTSVASALGTGTITITDAAWTDAIEGLAAIYYDATNSRAVFGTFIDSTASVTFTAAEFVAIAYMGMTTAEYTAMTASNFYVY